MLHIPRFMAEYGGYQKAKLGHSKLMADSFKQEAIARIDNAIRLYEQGIITVDEAMRIINDPLKE